MAHYNEQDLQGMLAGVTAFAPLKGEPKAIPTVVAELGIENKAPAAQLPEAKASVEAFLAPVTPGS